MKRGFIISLLLTFLPCQASFSLEKKIITLEEAVQMALEASEDVKMARNAVRMSESAARRARAGFRPYAEASFSMSGNFMHSDYYSALLDDYSMEMGLTLSQKLFDFGRTADAVGMADNQTEIAEAGSLEANREIIYAAKYVYYNIYLAKMIYFNYRESLERANSIRATVKERSLKGRASKYDNIKSLSDISSRKPLVSGAMADLMTVVHALATLLNLPVEQVGSDLSSLRIDISSDIFRSEYELLDHRALIVGLVKNHPALSRARLEIEFSALKENMLEKYYYPEFSVFASATKNGGGNVLACFGDLKTLGVLEIRAGVPLFDSGVRKENIKRARLEKENAKLRLAGKQKDLILALESAVAKYNEGVKILEANKRALALAQKSYDMSQDMFKSGYLSITDLNDAELALTGQKINLARTYVDLELLLAKIEKLAGAPDE